MLQIQVHAREGWRAPFKLGPNAGGGGGVDDHNDTRATKNKKSNGLLLAQGGQSRVIGTQVCISCLDAAVVGVVRGSSRTQQ